MSLRPVTRDVALAFHLPQTYGFLITRVDAGRSAGTSGLESGDILIALNGQRIADTPELKLKIREMAHGTTATVAVFRNGEIHQIEVNFGRAGSAAQSAAVGVRQGGTTVIAPPSPR
jgi:serine protease Do